MNHEDHRAGKGECSKLQFPECFAPLQVTGLIVTMFLLSLFPVMACNPNQCLRKQAGAAELQQQHTSSCSQTDETALKNTDAAAHAADAEVSTVRVRPHASRARLARNT